MPTACAPTVGRVRSNVPIAACERERWPSRARASRSSSFSLPPSTFAAGIRQSSRKTSAVCEARRPCFLTLVPIVSPGVPGPITNAAWPRARSSGSTVATTTWTSAMPPLVAQAFWPLSTHSLVASSNFARVRIEETSEPALGSDAQNAATFGSDSRAVALRHPLAHLLARAGAEDRGDGERRAHDRHADAGIAPEQLLVDHRQRDAGRVGVELAQRLEAVEADLRRLLDDRPRRLLALVPLGGGRAHDALGEAVDPVADVALVVGQLHREAAGHGLRVEVGEVGGAHVRGSCHCWRSLRARMQRARAVVVDRGRRGVGDEVAQHARRTARGRRGRGSGRPARRSRAGCRASPRARRGACSTGIIGSRSPQRISVGTSAAR